MAARNQSSCTKARTDIHTVKMAMIPLHFIIADPQTSAWSGQTIPLSWGVHQLCLTQGAENIVFGLGKSIFHVLDHHGINCTASLPKVRQNQEGPRSRGGHRGLHVTSSFNERLRIWDDSWGPPSSETLWNTQLFTGNPPAPEVQGAWSSGWHKSTKVQVYLGGRPLFGKKTPVFDRSWRSPSQNNVKNSTE